MTALEAARSAIERRDWERVLAEIAELRTESDEVLEMRASALYAVGDLEGCIGSWERLHARCAASGDHVGAARCAVMIALFLLIDTGMMAPVRGWAARAGHQLGGAPAGPVHAMLAVVRTYERLLSGDLAAAAGYAAEAVELGEQHDAVAAVVVGQVAQARLLALGGHVDAGVRALEEAGARLMGGAADPLTTGIMLCEIVCAAQGLGMPELAREWTDAMERWGRAAAFGGIGGRCRIHRAELLRMSGPCELAEQAASAACAELQPWMRREYGWPLVELGTIRLRKGDLVGAEEAFLAAEALCWSAQPGLALLRLAQGDAATAAALIADAIAHPPEIPWKERPPSGELRIAPLLDAQAEIAAASGDAARCVGAAERLARIANGYPSAGLAASAALAHGRAALVAGDHGAARRFALDAARRWAALGAPYESAAARVVAGDAAARAGDIATARLEWEAAARAFTDYGAACRVAEVQRRLGASAGPVAQAAVHATFRRAGAVRVVHFGAAVFTVPDLLGYRYLEYLLRHPGEHVAAVDLVAAQHGGARPAQLGLPALDDQARDAYRRRLREVDADIADATAMNDLARVALAQRDREFLIAELSRAVGLGGRIRAVGGDVERARTSVFRALRYAIDRLAALDPVLGEHLRHGVRTGSWCCYVPDPLAPVTWDVSVRGGT